MIAWPCHVHCEEIVAILDPPVLRLPWSPFVRRVSFLVEKISGHNVISSQATELGSLSQVPDPAAWVRVLISTDCLF